MGEDLGLIVEEIEEKKPAEEKVENVSAPQTLAVQNLDEIAEELYQEGEKISLQLVKMCSFDNADEREKFLKLMDGRSFGGAVQVFKSKAGLLWLRIGGHNLGPEYQPRRQHLEKIKEFLIAGGDNWQQLREEIKKQLSAVLEAARVARRDIIYPEFKEMEARIAELEKRCKEKDSQLRFSLDTWLMLMQEISSSLQRANSQIYAMLNEIGKK